MLLHLNEIYKHLIIAHKRIFDKGEGGEIRRKASVRKSQSFLTIPPGFQYTNKNNIRQKRRSEKSTRIRCVPREGWSPAESQPGQSRAEVPSESRRRQSATYWWASIGGRSSRVMALEWERSDIFSK